MLHRCHDEAVVNARQRAAQAAGFVRQHEVVATFGIQRYTQAGEAVGQRLAARTGAEDEAVGMVAVAIFRFEAEAAVFAAGSGDAAVFVNAAAARAQGLGEARAEGSEVKDVRRALVVNAAVLAGERRFQFLQFVAVQILAGKAQRLQLRGVCRQAGGGFGAARDVQDAIVAEKRRQ